MDKKKRFSSEELGEKAQSRVYEWAIDAGLTPMRPEPDRGGWDYNFIERRNEPTDGSSFFDTDPPELTCFAQVKGTTRGSKTYPISLRHWRTGSQLPQPWFFVILEYDDEGTAPLRSYLVHLDQAHVEKVAERLRKEGAKHKKKGAPKIHKLDMMLTWSESDEFGCDGHAMLAAIKSHVGPSISDYIKKKTFWWGAAGETTERNVFTVSIPGEDDARHRAMSDWAVGLTDSLNIAALRRTQYKFGIAREHEPVIGEMAIKMGSLPSAGETNVDIETIDGKERAQLRAEVLHSSTLFPGMLPKEHWQLRLRSRYISILLGHRRPVTVEFQIGEDDVPERLIDLAEVGKALRLLASDVRLTFGFPRRAGEVRVSDIVHANQANDLRALVPVRSLEEAWAIAQAFALPLTLTVEPGRLIASSVKIGRFYTVNFGTETLGKVDRLDAKGLLVGQEVGVLCEFALRMGRYILVSFAILRGKYGRGANGGVVEGNWEIAKRSALLAEDRKQWMKKEMIAIQKRLGREYENSGVTLLIPRRLRIE